MGSPFHLKNHSSSQSQHSLDTNSLTSWKLKIKKLSNHNRCIFYEVIVFGSRNDDQNRAE